MFFCWILTTIKNHLCEPNLVGRDITHIQISDIYLFTLKSEFLAIRILKKSTIISSQYSIFGWKKYLFLMSDTHRIKLRMKSIENYGWNL